MTALHQTLAANRRGRDFFLGDLHGLKGTLERALAARQFDPSVDRVICVGDLIDRGPESHACLHLLDQPWFHAVRGNHEQMMIDAWHGGEADLWYMNGGHWAAMLSIDTLEGDVALAEAMPVALTVEQPSGPPIGIVHAEYPLRDWDQVDKAVGHYDTCQQMLWGRTVLRMGLDQAVKGVRATIHGHTQLPHPVRLGTALFIDTGAISGGDLTLDTADGLLAAAASDA